MQRGLSKALLIGVTAGMRCFLAPAVLVCKRPSNALAIKLATGAAAAGEIACDKTPFIGNRIDAGPLAGRVIAGAVCGAFVAQDEDESPLLGLVAGGLAAFASAHLFYNLRRAVTEAGVPDIAFALAEDAAALAIASSACSAD